MPRRKLPEHSRDFENMNDKETLQQVLDDYQKSETFHKDKHDQITEWYKSYRSFIDEEKLKPGRSNLFIPYTMGNIETLKAKIINSMFSERPFVSTKVLDVSDKEEAEAKSKQMNKFLQYQFEQKIKVIAVTNITILEALVAGVAITKQGWKYKKKTVKKRRAGTTDSGDDAPNVPVTKDEEVIVADHPTMKHVPYDLFFPDPAGTTIEEARYVIEKEYLDYADLLENKDYNQPAVKRLKDSNDQFNMNTNKQLESVGYINSTKDSRKDVEILHYHTDDWKISVANRKEVLISEPNPLYHMEKPFAKWELVPVSGQWWGVSSVEMMYPLQMELNTHRNQRVDNVSFILNKMHKVRRGSNISESDLVSRAGGVINVDEMDDIEELKFQDVTSAGYNEEAVIKKDMDTVIGVHEVSRGGSTERRETATMASITEQNSNERFTLTIKMIEFGGFKDAIAQIIQLNQQFITNDTPYLTPGEQGEFSSEVMKESDILHEYELVGIGKSIGYMSNRDVKQNQLANLLNTLSPYSAFLNIPELLTQVFTAFEISESDKLIKTEEDVKAEAKEAQDMEQQNQMGGQPQMAQQQAQPEPQPQMGGQEQGQDQMIQQVIGQVVQVLQQETQGKVNPETLVKLVLDVLKGNPPQDQNLQPLVQRIMELFQQFSQGGQGGQL